MGNNLTEQKKIFIDSCYQIKTHQVQANKLHQPQIKPVQSNQSIQKLQNRVISEEEQSKIQNNFQIQKIVKYPLQQQTQQTVSFDLYGNDIGAEGIRYMQTKHWINLTILRVNASSLGDQGCRQISLAGWNRLRQLINNSISQKGLLYLCQTDWKQLHNLSIGWNKIGNEGLKHFELTNWKLLHSIDLRCNGLGKKKQFDFSRATQWKQIASFVFRGNNLKSQQMEQINEKMKQFFPELIDIKF